MILQQIIKKFFCSRAYQKVIIYYRSIKDKKVLQLKSWNILAIVGNQKSWNTLATVGN